MHIFLTGRCNLNCQYCFANDIKNEFNEEMSASTFNSIVEFASNKQIETIGLLGGEPFLHSEFFDFLQILLDISTFKTIIIYTNGLFDSSYIDKLQSKQIIMSVNCNSPIFLKNKYNKLLKNLQKLKEKNIYTGISLNLPYLNFDYSYIFEVLSLLDKNTVRFSFATSTKEKLAIKNPITYFDKLHGYIMSFYKDCYNNNIIPITSCNAIPLCLLNSEDKRLILKLHKRAETTSHINVLSCFTHCTPPVTILPDLTAIRCFSFPSEARTPIMDFSSAAELEQHFINKIDKNKSCFINSNFMCKKCAFNKAGLCRTCFSYKE